MPARTITATDQYAGPGLHRPHLAVTHATFTMPRGYKLLQYPALPVHITHIAAFSQLGKLPLQCLHRLQTHTHPDQLRLDQLINIPAIIAWRTQKAK